MIIYLDENIAPTIAKGINILQFPENLKSGQHIEIKALEDDFGRGSKDEDWIPELGKTDSCIITQDLNIRKIRAQRELCEKYNVGIIFIKPPSNRGFSYWDMVKLLTSKWPEISTIVRQEIKPFAYKISAKGKIEKL